MAGKGFIALDTSGCVWQTPREKTPDRKRESIRLPRRLPVKLLVEKATFLFPPTSISHSLDTSFSPSTRRDRCTFPTPIHHGAALSHPSTSPTLRAFSDQRIASRFVRPDYIWPSKLSALSRLLSLFQSVRYCVGWPTLSRVLIPLLVPAHANTHTRSSSSLSSTKVRGDSPTLALGGSPFRATSERRRHTTLNSTRFSSLYLARDCRPLFPHAIPFIASLRNYCASTQAMLHQQTRVHSPRLHVYPCTRPPTYISFNPLLLGPMCTG